MTISLSSSRRGAAIVLTLVFVAGIAILAISLLSVSSQKSRISGDRANAVRAELATDAAFEAAKNLLLSQTANDSFLVTSVLDGDWAGAPPARYTFLTRPGPSGFRHIPLFSAPDTQASQTKSYPPDIHANPADAEGKSGLAPVVAPFQPEDPAPFVLPPLTHLQPKTGELVRENPRPQVALQEVDAGDSRNTIQYAYWIEDLQGYPNLDVAGIPSAVDHLGQAMRWGGYSADDPRLAEPVFALGKSSLEQYRFEFPGVLAPGEQNRAVPSQLPPQRLAGQVAPGLSPREIHFFPWKTPQFEAASHPYWRVTYLRAGQSELPSLGSGVMLAGIPPDSGSRKRFGINFEERFAVGLRGYRYQPLIPYGHRYPNAGEPCFNLNAAIDRARIATEESRPEDVDAEVLAIARHMAKSLPAFGSRKGGFPEDYLRTLAASMVDYADADSAPTIADPATYSEAERFRGMDGFPVVNEFFLHLKLTEKPDVGAPNGPVTFTGHAWAELWNPANQVADLTNLELRFRFVEPLSFQEADGSEHVLDEEKLFPAAFGGELEPNELRIVDFGEVEWSFEVDKSPGLPWVFLGAAGPDGKDARGHYELLLDGKVIDQSGRPPADPTNTGFPDHGFHLSRFTDGPLYSKDYQGDRDDGQLYQGDSIMMATSPALNVGDKASNFGDTRMSYWVRDTQESEYYANNASPGVRNFLRKLYKRSSSGGRGSRFDMEALPSQWPDRAYDSPTYNAPSSSSNTERVSTLRDGNSDDADFIFPDAPTLRNLAAQAHRDRAPAPFRVSNQGRVFALSELGHIYDPVMWQPYGGARVYDYYSEHVLALGDLSTGVGASQVWGGGNTLRIGRREHPLFDTLGTRAAQLADLFHLGVNGSNCPLGTGSSLGDFAADASTTAYENYNAAWHQPPPTARNAVEATQKPFRIIYPRDVHASSPFEWVHGQLNINSVPTLFEIEALLQGAFSSLPVKKNPDWTSPDQNQNNPRQIAEPPYILGEREDFLPGKHELNTDAGRDVVPRKTLHQVAERLYDRRPYFSRSDLIYEVAEAVAESRSSEPEQLSSPLPDTRDDALSEEIAARILNTTTLSSRHFRIYTYGQVINKRRTASSGFVLSEGGELLARDAKVYEVFLEPVRDPATGRIRSTQMRILNVRSL